MIAKVIAHGATRAEAVRRLTAALRGAELIGPVTNRDLLLELLSWVADFDAPGGPGIDTGLVDRSAEANGGSPIGEPPPHRPIDVAAAALALVQRRSNGNRFPIGWRNNPSQSHVQAVGEPGFERIGESRRWRHGNGQRSAGKKQWFHVGWRRCVPRGLKKGIC